MPSQPLTSVDVMRWLVEHCPHALIVSACGYISRELYNLCDRDEHLYLVGSMGATAAVASGLAVASGRMVVALDGDGGFAMNLSVLPMIAAENAHIVHVVLDNGCHESTGGQATVPVNPVAHAFAAGYRHALTVVTPEDLSSLTITTTPMLVHALVGRRREMVGKRIPYHPRLLTQRLRLALTDSTAGQSNERGDPGLQGMQSGGSR